MQRLLTRCALMQRSSAPAFRKVGQQVVVLRPLWSAARPVPLKLPTQSIVGTTVRNCSSNGRAKAEEAREKNLNIAYWMATVGVATLAASYLAVPLYRLFCQSTGYDLAKQEEAVARLKEMTVDERAAKREILVRFDAGSNDKLQWKFKPLQRAVTVIPGKSSLAFYNAENKADEAIIGMATYSVTPTAAGRHFKKIQCFCFEEQRLQAGEEVDMPVLFFMDPELLDDENMHGINDVTLSYTFFEAADSEGIAASTASGALLGTDQKRYQPPHAKSNY
eukprot:TRINITY_DN10266_c0_g1_i1.p1 TRINITY_DN10266_c0_g1~~TRINITY_DN10266_c0_g1_i1.p1  ORF type:complete len:278 (+),score=62.42 TRINITY_DN10266_c0_g1_i1:135-968(+)